MLDSLVIQCAFRLCLLIWLGFRMANNGYNSPDANVASKVFTSLFCVLVAIIVLYAANALFWELQ